MDKVKAYLKDAWFRWGGIWWVVFMTGLTIYGVANHYHNKVWSLIGTFIVIGAWNKKPLYYIVQNKEIDQ